MSGDHCVNCGAAAHREASELDGVRFWSCPLCGPCVVASECITCRNPGGVPLATHPTRATRTLRGRDIASGETRYVCDAHAAQLLAPPFDRFWTDPDRSPEVRLESPHTLSSPLVIFTLGGLCAAIAIMWLRAAGVLP